MSPELAEFSRGILFAGYLVIGLFFCRYWSRTRDRLFVWFAAAFWMLALERLAMLVTGASEEGRYALVHLIRLAAFVMIIVAIASKNLSLRRGASGRQNGGGQA